MSVQEKSCVSDALPKTAVPCNTAPEAQGFRSHAELKSALQRVEKQLASQPDSVPLLFLRGNLLNKIGRSLEARNTYVELLRFEPAHTGALDSLGNLLVAAGKTKEARTLFSQVVATRPDDIINRVNFAALLIKCGEPEKALEHLEHALKIDPNCRQAHAGLSFALANLGKPEQASRHRRTAFQGRCVIPAVYRGERPPITVLELLSTTGGGIRLDGFLSDRFFQKYYVVVQFYDANTTLPPHQLVVNTIGDAEVAADALSAAQSLLAHTTAPVINAPSAVLATGRCDVAQRLAGVPGVITPRTTILPRDVLASSDAETILSRHGFEFPLLLRTPGFHTGDHFLRVENTDELRGALAELPGQDLLVIGYLDGRGPDQKVRKYRVMTIDGQLYPLHVAISNHWKVHYFTADMADNPEHRAEDARFLADMSGVLGPRAMAALAEIQKTLGLDYGGIDFGLNAEGDVLLFEANATMAIISPDADKRWDYRRAAVEQIYRAVLKMLMGRAKSVPQENHST